MRESKSNTACRLRLRGCHALCKVIENDGYHNAGSSNAGFTVTDVGIDADAFLPVIHLL